ncbi:tetratricopeptide repeat protein [Leucobacter viscericola]|uniref:Tetratricopeptide repeat protein n=1 Tax=Leucobacter viscericola TaxID=2714935 RepID=A0A6G7XGS4_9MICO|nr:tetratricopeptide repeat protein [Leucobacter viscericola]QIK63765.1 tetratricopeptide repeat protein [Leucobacter viscericola]
MSGSSLTGDMQEQRAVESALQRTELLAYQDRSGEALELLDGVLAAYPRDSDLLAQRSWLLNRLDRIDAALEAANEALSIDPYNKQALLQTSNVQLRKREYDQAEQTLLDMLQMWPEDPQFHGLYALAIARQYDSPAKAKRSDKQKRLQHRKLAFAHFEKALELAPEDPDGYEVAARVVFIFSEYRAWALDYADRGLALAPEHLGLIQIRSVILEALSAASTKRSARRESQVVAVRESNRILRLNPGNTSARLRLFHLFSYHRRSLLETPLVGMSLILLNIVIILNGDQMMLFFPGLLAAIVWTVLRIVRYRRVASQIDRGFTRAVVRGTPFAALRIVLSVIAWGVMAVTGAMLPFVRDAVLMRWMIVALGVGVLAQLAALLIWQIGYPAASQRFGGATGNADSLAHSARFRLQMLIHVVLRVLLGATVAVVFLTSKQREDATAVLGLAFAAMLLWPLVGMIAASLAERRRFAALPANSAVRDEHRAPRVSGLIWSGIAAAVVVAMLSLNLASLPVLPNKYDAVGSYRLPAAPSDSECRDQAAGHPGCPGQETKKPDPKPTYPTYTPLDIDSLKNSVIDVPEP